MKITATFIRQSRRGHYLLRDVQGGISRDHAWLNGRYNSLPDIRPGSRISLIADPMFWKEGIRLTSAREVKVV